MGFIEIKLRTLSWVVFYTWQELEAIKARVKEMEEEAEKLKEMQNAVDLKMNMSSPTLCKFRIHSSYIDNRHSERDAESVTFKFKFQISL